MGPKSELASPACWWSRDPPLLLVRGVLLVESNVVTVKARAFVPLAARVGAEHAPRHDYH